MHNILSTAATTTTAHQPGVTMPKSTKIIHGYVIGIHHHTKTETEVTLVEKYGNRWQYCIPITPQVGEVIQMWDLIALRVTGIEVEEGSHPSLRGPAPKSADLMRWGFLRSTTQWKEVTEVCLVAPPQRVPRLGGWFHRVDAEELEKLQKYFCGYGDALGEDIYVYPNTSHPEYLNLIVSTRRNYVQPISTVGKTDYSGEAESAIHACLRSNIIVHEPAEDLAQKLAAAASQKTPDKG